MARTHECPSCGWRLNEIGFCIHHSEMTGEIVEVFDGVPAQVSEQQWQEEREARAEIRAAARAKASPAPTTKSTARPGEQMRLA